MSCNVDVSDTDYVQRVVFREACRFYCDEEGEGVCALLSLFADGGRVVFRVLPRDFCAWGEERAD